MPEFNYVDLIVLGIFILSTIIGVARGFTREFFGIIAWVGACFATIFGIIWARPLIHPLISNPLIADAVTGLFIFVTTLFVLGSFSKYISVRVKGSLLGGLDRSLGLLFGLARAAAIFILVYFGVSLVWNPEKWPKEVKDAKSLPYIAQGSNWLKSVIPEEVIKNLGLKSDSKEEEAAALDKSLDQIVFALSHPSAAAIESARSKTQGYDKDQRKEIDHLVEKNEK